MSLHEFFHRYPKKFPLPLVLDGSTGTSLMRCGMPAGACTEKWVLENPDSIKSIQSEYRNAGSDALYTPTFGANRPTLERSELYECEKLNRKLAALTVGNGCLSGGDMSPTGLMIEPFGETPFDEVVAVYSEQAKALDEAGVDFFVAETNISLQEARAAVMGIRAVSDKPVFVTVTVDEDGYTLNGDELSCCLMSLSELGISAFGTNCSQGPEGMLKLLRKIVPLSIELGIPLIAKPNAGMPHEDENGHRRFDLDADSFAQFIPEFLESGIPILGGCCGTDADFIKHIRASVDEMSAALDYSGIEPAGTKCTACTNRLAVTADKSTLGEAITVADDFYDRVSEKLDEGAEIVLVSFPDEASAEIFTENAPMLPVAFAVCGDAAAIESAKHYYNGKLLVI